MDGFDFAAAVLIFFWILVLVLLFSIGPLFNIGIIPPFSTSLSLSLRFKGDLSSWH